MQEARSSPTKSSLTPARARLVEMMQRLNFGRIKGLVVRDGEPVFDPPPRVLREFKPGGENARRPEAELCDFALKRDVVELLEHFSQLQNATIHSIEVKYGLPFRVVVVEEDSAA